MLSLTGCSALQLNASLKDERPVTVVGCAAFSPIYLPDETIGKLDRDTKEEIASHNLLYSCLCDEKAEKPKSCKRLLTLTK